MLLLVLSPSLKPSFALANPSMPLPRWCQLPAWLVLPGCKLHTNVLLCLCKQAKNTVVLLLGGLGVQRGWEGSWGQAAPGERRHTEAQSHGWIPGCCEWGWLQGQTDRQHIPTALLSCCPAVLLPCPAEPALPALLTSLLTVCARCDSERSRALCFSSEEEFLSFPLNFCARCCDAGPGVLQSAVSSRHCTPVSRGDTICWAPLLRVPWVRLVPPCPLRKEVRKAYSFRYPISEGIKS